MARLDKKYRVVRNDTSNMDTPSILLNRGEQIKGVSYKVVDIPKEERANLPMEVRFILFFQLKEFEVSKRLIRETREKYPKYFEPVLESNIVLK